MTMISMGLLACASPPPGSQPFISKAQHIQLDGFSIVTPSEPGWIVASRNHASLHLARKGGETDETYAIQAWQIDLPLFHTNEEFSSYVSQAIEKDTNGVRFRKIKTNVSAVSTKHGICVRLNSIHTDNLAVKESNNSRPMLLETESMTCRNPYFHTRGAHLALSNRYYEGNRDTSLREKAESFFKSLAFDKIRSLNAI